MKKQFILILSFLMLFSISGESQSFVPGETYLSANGYIEYQAGNLPIILTAPHGGYLEPNEIPDRNCSGCVYVRDSYTQELTREIAQEIHNLTGCYPHIIYNLLHRKKLDANRAIGDGADGNSIGQDAWRTFHGFIDTSRSEVYGSWEKGLHIDMHGHGHDIQRLELGYLLSGSELRMSDGDLEADNFYQESSIQSLRNNNLQNLSFTKLLRGDESMGSLIVDKGYPAVPSNEDDAPSSGDSYFSGGYITQEYGSQQSGSIDAIQIECNQDVRFEESDRQAFAIAIAESIVEFTQLHYFNTLAEHCLTSSLPDETDSRFLIYPNPASDLLQLLPNDFQYKNYRIMDVYGSVVLHGIFNGNGLNIDQLPSGIYLLDFTVSAGRTGVLRFVKN